MRRRSATRRAGFSALETVICAGVLMVIAAALYYFLEQQLEAYFFILGTAVSSPF